MKRMTVPESTERTISPGEIRYKLLAIIRGMTVQPDGEEILDLFNDIVSRLIKCLMTSDDQNGQIRIANKMVGAQNSDVFIQRLNGRIAADGVLHSSLARFRETPTDTTVTAFRPPAITAKELVRIDSITGLLAHLKMPVTLDHDLDADERRALSDEITRLADFEVSGWDIAKVPPALRDHVRHLLIDSAGNPDQFAAALLRAGPVESGAAQGKTDPEEIIGTFQRIRSFGGSLDELPTEYDIRTKAWELLADTGGKITLRGGCPLFVPKKTKQ